MLAELNIRNFAIIDELKVAFRSGLNVISGETGAGKSILIGAVSLILGDRASSDQIRSSEESATVEALFTLGDHPGLKESLAALGIEADDELIVRRTISRSGKNRIHLNGQLANLHALASISEGLINICGQHEHQLILDAGNHIDILDEFGGIMPARMEYRKGYDEYLSLRSRLDELKALADQRIRAEEFLRFQLKEIEEAAVAPGEDASLAEEKKVIRNAALLRENAEACYDALYGRDGSILAELRGVIGRVGEIGRIDQGLDIPVCDLDSASSILEETALALRDYLKKIDFNPDRLGEIEDRLDLLGRLKRKYGGSLQSVLARKEEIARELNGFDSADEEIGRLSGRMEALEAEMLKQASALTGRRKEAARRLKAAVEREIRQLKMEHARFDIPLRTRPAAGEPSAVDLLATLGPAGADEIEFYLSPNVGEDLKPLNRIASGGELSRIILALKKVLAGTGSVGTIIFDEVDSGIGGAVAEVVGEKLRDVSRSHQIICITHLPQIACFGDSHYFVSKQVSGDRTNTQIRLLEDAERQEEIARMLAGLDITEKTKEHAREMLERSAKRDKPHGAAADKKLKERGKGLC